MRTYVMVHGAWHGAWCWYKSCRSFDAPGTSWSRRTFQAWAGTGLPVSGVPWYLGGSHLPVRGHGFGTGRVGRAQPCRNHH